jgi:hypothetical protein
MLGLESPATIHYARAPGKQLTSSNCEHPLACRNHPHQAVWAVEKDVNQAVWAGGDIADTTDIFKNNFLGNDLVTHDPEAAEALRWTAQRQRRYRRLLG